jgi:phage-related protein
MVATNRESLEPLIWIYSSKSDLKSFPEQVQRHIGFALKVAQSGGKHPDAKPLKGFGNAGVLEIIEDYAGDTYRAVYTVRFEEAVYVLHAFQKKSRSGIGTPLRETTLIKARLKFAESLHRREIH